MSDAPGAIALLEPQQLDRAIAGVGDAVRRACRHERLVDGGRELDGDVQLPAELADIGDAQGEHRRAGERHAPDATEWEARRSRGRRLVSAESTSRARGPISESTA